MSSAPTCRCATECLVCANAGTTDYPCPECGRQTMDGKVEGAARAMWMYDFEMNTGLEARPSSWPDVENPEHYRELARIALHSGVGRV